jgi:hypothetical protein
LDPEAKGTGTSAETVAVLGTHFRVAPAACECLVEGEEKVRLGPALQPMTFHPEVLGTLQQRVLRRLGPILTTAGYYLAGGTGLAIQLGHRRSLDLDWFTQKVLKDPRRLARSLTDEGMSFTTSLVESGTLYGAVSGIRVSFLEYPYPLLQPLIPWPDFGCSLAALPDLAAMKLAAVERRGAKKDFVDIYALGSKHASLVQMLDAYREKYAHDDVSNVLFSLTYFDDADPERMPRMLWETDWRTVKKTIQRWVKEVTV